MKKTALVILAAGVGARFGEEIKQLTPVGPNGEIILNYSIYDALNAGFNKVVFIIRKELEKDFREVIGNRLERICQVEYVFQDLNDLPEGFEKPADRTRPWGTGQALLACKNVIQEPFVVINADDYYGVEAFKKVHDYLMEHYEEQYNYCMAGFILGNTLSDNGGVTRGICQVDENDCLRKVIETHNIVKAQGGAAVEGTGELLNPGLYVSMNMWGLTPEFLDGLEQGFKDFLEHVEPGDVKAEYLLPTIIDGMIQSGRAKVTVLETQDKWFGVTYQEDKQAVVEAFQDLIDEGVYSYRLFW